MDNRLYTVWGEKLDVENVLPEYPRPQFVRDSYVNLNGKWKYAILKADEELKAYQGDIIVPFSPESILSGVEKILQPDEKLYYERTFVLPEGFNKGRVLLNFGAVDYECEVFVNDLKVGGHKGGYYPFSFDITDALKAENVLKVVVVDPSDTGVQAKGKQTLKDGGIWYYPISGIWQTVWLESVPLEYVESMRITPNVEDRSVSFEVKPVGEIKKGKLIIKDGDKVLADGDIELKATLKLNEFQLWCPENPKLYDVELTYGDDVITSYFGMRSFGVGKDALGVPRMLLNGKPYFQTGLLDQGYWSDGLYTAPSDEALIYDIQTMKDMGFNMLRKHIKVEPLRWYYHCDRLGMIVWQDVVNGSNARQSSNIVRGILPGLGMVLGLPIKTRRLLHISDGPKHYKLFSRDSQECRDEFYRDLDATVNGLYNCVSIGLWTPFNEGWGQFDSEKAFRKIRAMDKTRVIDAHSGWHDQGCPDLLSYHIYFTPFLFPKYSKNDERPRVMSEFGGYSHKISGHVHNEKTVFGYRFYSTPEALQTAFGKLYEKIIKSIDKVGLSASVYTEVSDVQDEINGLLTYDRRVTKLPVEFVKGINDRIKDKFKD